jgi:hypothetical protein
MATSLKTIFFPQNEGQSKPDSLSPKKASAERRGFEKTVVEKLVRLQV